MTTYDLIYEIIAHAPDPTMEVVVNVNGREVECYNHRADNDDVVNFEKETTALNVTSYDGKLFLEVDL